MQALPHVQKTADSSDSENSDAPFIPVKTDHLKGNKDHVERPSLCLLG